MEHLRERLSRAGVCSSGDLDDREDGAPVVISGLVVARQHPSTSKGTVFLLLEDEHGFVNVIVPPAVGEANREVVRHAAVVAVRGWFQKDGLEMNVVGEKFRALEIGPIAHSSRDFH